MNSLNLSNLVKLSQIRRLMERERFSEAYKLLDEIEADAARALAERVTIEDESSYLPSVDYGQ